jgi:hypothetical protein
MKRISMNIGTHGVETTASEMRKRLAQVLSKIPGDQIVFFNLTLHLENYSPVQSYGDKYHENLMQTTSLGELARPEND